MTETTTRKFPEAGEFHSTNTASSGVVFEIRAALGLSRAAFAKAIKGNVRTIEGAERRGGALAGLPGTEMFKLARALPSNKKTLAIRNWIDEQETEYKARAAALAGE